MPRRNRAPVLLALVVALVLVVAAVARIWTDLLWFRQLGSSSVFTTRLLTGLGLGLGWATVMVLVMGGNLLLAGRIAQGRIGTRRGAGAGSHRAARPGAPRPGGAWLAATVVGALVCGASAFSRRDLLLAWWQATSFGIRDPWFDKDVAFYVFDYPWWRFVVGESFWVLALTLLATAAHHIVGGSLASFDVRTGPRGEPVVTRLPGRNRAQAQAQISVLCGLLLVLWSASCWLDRFGYAVSTNYLFTGIDYSDLHARVVARTVVCVISVLCAALFFANAWIRRWSLPTLSVVLMVVSSLLLQGIYPAFVQRFVVLPTGPVKEHAYIAANIAATRQGFGIDQVAITDNASITTTASAGQLASDAQALPGIRLVDPQLIAPTFEQLQQVRGYYTFPKVLDVDRYTIDGRPTDAVVAAREIDRSQIPEQSWTNLHTVYTHGFGLVAAYGNRRQGNGEPVWIARDIPPVGALAQQQSRIYFGEQSSDFAVVGAPGGSAPVELDTPGGGQKAPERRNTYDGRGGVGIGNLLIRTLHAIRFGDANLLLSTGRVNSASRILYDRQPRARVEKVAPWLTTDSDPYPALVEGRVQWIVDGYTTTPYYPNSTRLDLAASTEDANTGRGHAGAPVNYVRNCVKAVVDAYDGTVTLYAWDTTDPLLQTWQKVYPGLVKPRAAIPASLLAHMRYPSDLFRMQREVLGRYHVTNPDTWFQQSDLWEVPDDPVAPGTQKEAPHYLSIRWPGDPAPVFSQTSVMVPRGRQTLAAYVAVNADASSRSYGKLRVLKLPDSQQVAGPSQIYNAMSTDERVASKLRPYLMQGSAQAHFGNLLTIPLGGGLLYVSPIYTQQATTTGGYLVLRFVVVRFGEHIGIGETLQQALDSVFKGDAGAQTGESGLPAASPGTGTRAPARAPATGQVTAKAALAQAATAFDAADAALRRGDLAAYQKQLAIARQKVAVAEAALR